MNPMNQIIMEYHKQNRIAEFNQKMNEIITEINATMMEYKKSRNVGIKNKIMAIMIIAKAFTERPRYKYNTLVLSVLAKIIQDCKKQLEGPNAEKFAGGGYPV